MYVQGMYRYASINDTKDLNVLCEQFYSIFDTYTKNSGED